MTFGTDDVQTAGRQHGIMTHLPVRFDFSDLLCGWLRQRGNLCLPATAQHNIGTTTGHVGGDGHRRRVARLGHDRRFVGVEFGVQNVVLDTRFGQLV